MRSSNHEACVQAEMLTFEHIRNQKMFNFAFLLRETNSPCFLPIKNYFISRSNFIKCVNKLAYEKYDIIDVFANDFDAILARISYVFLREPRYSCYVPTTT